MSYDIQQSTTSYELLFLLVLSSDHISAATGKTPTVTIRKAGGSFGSPAGSVSEIANGWYKVAGNATDTATLGPLLLHVTEASSDPVDREYNVVKYNPQATDLGLTEPSETYAAPTGQATFSSLIRLAIQTLLNSTWTPGSSTGTLTVVKQDGSTTAATSTGNDPVNPSNVLRAT